MRCVADTNVIVSGLLWLGGPGQVLEAAATGTITLYTSPPMIAELDRVLGYGRLARRIENCGLTRAELLRRLLDVTIVVEPTPTPPVARDPDDDMVLGCALAAQAQIIVTGDDDLLDLGTWNGIPILRPSELIQRLSAKAP